MQTFNQQELMNFFGVSESMIKTNFPLLCQRQLAKGYLITKRGKGNNAQYDVEKVEPQVVDKSFFSSRPIEKAEDLEGEYWVTTYQHPAYEVSNLGRVRHKQTKVLNQGYISPTRGYHTVSLGNVNYQLHRIVLQSFDPREDFEIMTVDHINGIRSDNRLENLRWASEEENIAYMLSVRADLNRELTRIIQKIGYDETLQLLQSL